MDALGKENANPEVFTSEVADRVDQIPIDPQDNERDELDAMEVFEYIRHVNDPEHPLTLEQLHVLEQITVAPRGRVVVRFTPTIPHCSMATLIGLCLRVKLTRSLPRRYKVSVRIAEGSHSSEAAVNKQLNDKERVAAAMENTHLLEVVNKCLAGSDKAASNILVETASIDALLGALALEPAGNASGAPSAATVSQPAAAKLAAL